MYSDSRVIFREYIQNACDQIDLAVKEHLICQEDANIDISFSAKYMMDALKTFKDEDILILLNGDIKPIVIKSVTDESLIQLILPVKTY